MNMSECLITIQGCSIVFTIGCSILYRSECAHTICAFVCVRECLFVCQNKPSQMHVRIVYE